MRKMLITTYILRGATFFNIILQFYCYKIVSFWRFIRENQQSLCIAEKALIVHHYTNRNFRILGGRLLTRPRLGAALSTMIEWQKLFDPIGLDLAENDFTVLFKMI